MKADRHLVKSHFMNLFGERSRKTLISGSSRGGGCVHLRCGYSEDECPCEFNLLVRRSRTTDEWKVSDLTRLSHRIIKEKVELPCLGTYMPTIGTIREEPAIRRTITNGNHSIKNIQGIAKDLGHTNLSID